jgi:hypothetical protein
MSQKLVANPTPQAASTALSNTQAVAPELANRREIPLSVFDFLNGAYNATKRARLITLIAIILVLLLGVYVSAGTLLDSFKAGDIKARLEDVEAEKIGLIAEFGTEVNGLQTKIVLDRDKELSSGLATVTASQGDLVSVLAEISGLVSSEASVLSVSYGSAAESKSDTAAATTTTIPGATQATKAASSIALRIVIRGESIAAAANAADRIRQVSSLQNVEVDVQGREVIINATLALSKPPRAMLERLIGLGVRSGTTPAAADTQSTTTTAPPSIPAEGEG